jgi:hypothetical protein
MNVAELFALVRLAPQGPVLWRTHVRESRPGVYVVTYDPDGVVYVGCTARQSLRKRLGQFYRHRHGHRSPHRGGQDVLLLTGARYVHWAVARDPIKVERVMLSAFVRATGRLPLANKKRGDRTRIPDRRR